MTILDTARSLYVDGEFLAASETDEVINPATEEVIGEAPVGDASHVEAALDAARRAFDNGPWPRLPQSERQAILSRFLYACEARSGELVELIVAESGSLRMFAEYVQFGMAISNARHLITISGRPSTMPLPVSTAPNMDGTLSLNGGVVSREPVGVATVITPYNVPFHLNIGKIIPALIVGCTVILKPSPYTPFEALILGRIAEAAGLPKGVLNIVTGGVAVGTALTSDPRVDIVTFTGSDVVGAAVQAQAAPTLKRVVMELGGKSAMIVRPDANIAAAAAAGMGGITTHCGQGCVLLTRHIVHNSIRKEYVRQLTGMLASVKLGDPNDPTTTMGPLIRAQARTRVEDYVEIARAGGGKLVSGGKRPVDLPRGFFYEPTLFDDVTNDSRIAQEEVFGPIGAVIGYGSDEEAIAIANDSQYGLFGSVYSADVGLAYEMALQLRTGGVAVNGGFPQLNKDAPFGGVKRSGHGRENGLEGLNEFTYLKTIDFHGA